MVCSIWLPYDTGIEDPAIALERFRIVALQQAMRATGAALLRSSAQATPLFRDVYLLVEAYASDEALARELPGIVGSLAALRRASLYARPPLTSFPMERQPLETLGADAAAAEMRVRGQ